MITDGDNIYETEMEDYKPIMQQEEEIHVALLNKLTKLELRRSRSLFSKKGSREGIRRQFKPYSEIIDNMTNMYVINTQQEDQDPENVIACVMSIDSRFLIIILKNCDEYFSIQVLNTTNFNITLKIDLKGDYIKASDIKQNATGKVFCVPYLKDGHFHIVIFTCNVKLNDINLSEMIKLNQYIRPNDNLDFPLIDSAFYSILSQEKRQSLFNSNINDHDDELEQEKIFVAMFVSKSNEIHMLSVCHKTHKTINIHGKCRLMNKNGSQKDFPIGCFFDEKRDQIYVVMRLGEVVIANFTSNDETKIGV